MDDFRKMARAALQLASVAGRRSARAVCIVSLASVALLLLPGWVGAADGAVFNVNGTSDGTGTCSGSSCPTLRSAVMASNAAEGSNTINLPAGTYTLTLTPSGPDDGMTGDLHINANVTIAGAGAGQTSIHGDGDRIFDIAASASAVTLSGLTIEGGSSQQFGGAINSVGASLTLTGDSLIANTTSNLGFGGALFMEPSGDGTLTVTDSTFSSNIAADTNASGGGFGGAIMFEPSEAGTITIANSTFDSNTAQGGSASQGGFGGAIMFEPASGSLTVTASTFSANTADAPTAGSGFGGAISFEPGEEASSTLSLTNSTLTGNRANGKGFGGAIDFEGATSTATLLNDTIVANTVGSGTFGGGIENEGQTTARNTIISGNTTGAAVNNCGNAPIAAGSHDLELGTSCGFDMDADPKLAPLAENGGPTETMALLAGSPAIGAGDSAFCPATDQRGVPRPQPPIGTCDVGAYQSPPLAHPANNQSQPQTKVLPAPTTADAASPIVTDVAQSHRSWREGTALASFTRRRHKLAPRGTTFSFTLNDQASVSFAFTQRVSGRKVKIKCVAQTKKNILKPACQRVVSQGTLSLTGHSGKNDVAFQGRISRSRKLAPGNYTLLITATNAAGRSTPKAISFTILK